MFTWTEMYKELAGKILEYRDRQDELIDLLKDIASDGLPMVRLEDKPSPEETGPLKEIDPFTFFAGFNRGITRDHRIAILTRIKEHFGLKADVPSDWDGIPVVFPMNSWFFSWEYERRDDHIDQLWDLAAQAVEREPHELDGDLFDRCLPDALGKGTMGLFWLAPYKFVACDSKNLEYLAGKGITIEEEDFEGYLTFLHDVTEELGEEYPQISYDAWMATQKKREEKKRDEKPGAEPADETDSVKTARRHQDAPIPLNLILYGPPGTGKTYRTADLAVELCDGELPDTRDEVMERFRDLRKEKRIEFVTFHQSYSYEEFVEGIKPEVDDESGQVVYDCAPGVFRTICSMANPGSGRSGEYDFDPETIGIWKMSLGNTTKPEEAEIYDTCIKNNFVRIGYGQGLDFTGADTREAVLERLRQEHPDTKSTDYDVTSVNNFKNEMQVGDLVIVSDGNRKFRAIGKVTGEYQYEANAEHQQIREVEWLFVADESLPRETILDCEFSQATIYQPSGQKLNIDAIRELVSSSVKPEEKKYVLVIDEINRGNIAKVLGELITLLEPDKRLGAKNSLSVRLPYSEKTKAFGVPPNLHVIGTMNTADRSIAFMDAALRRRFDFWEVMPDYDLLEDVEGVDVPGLLKAINRRIEFLYDRDHQIGHSYFMELETLHDLRGVFLNRVIPLLQEYFYGDWEKLCMVLGCAYNVETGEPEPGTANGAPLIVAEVLEEHEVLGFDHAEYENKVSYRVNPEFRTAEGDRLRLFFENILSGTPDTPGEGTE